MGTSCSQRMHYSSGLCFLMAKTKTNKTHIGNKDTGHIFKPLYHLYLQNYLDLKKKLKHQPEKKTTQKFLMTNNIDYLKSLYTVSLMVFHSLEDQTIRELPSLSLSS